MHKILVTTQTKVVIVIVSDEILNKYSDIEECLIANSEWYNSSNCDYIELPVDAFGNSEIEIEILTEK